MLGTVQSEYFIKGSVNLDTEAVFSKTRLKGKYLVTRVYFKLSIIAVLILNTDLLRMR